jgi:4-amino-4-deoxy-L-arabinose transferase-like glycosyltransferase
VQAVSEAPAPSKGLHPGWIAALIGVVCFLLLAATNSLYGITYDEPIYQSKSMQAVEWLKALAVNPGYAISAEGGDRYWQATDMHPGFYKLVTGISGVTVASLTGSSEALRTGTNLLAALCLAALYLFVAPLWGRAAGLYAVGALLLMPHVFAACHLAALDAPIMAMCLLTIAATWRAAYAESSGATGGEEGAPRRRLSPAWRWSLLAGLLWGLALGTKLNAFFVPFVVFPWALLYARRHLAKLALCYAVLGPLAFLGTWPWLWHDTATRFCEYFQFHFRHWEIAVTYFGKAYQVAPWHYPLVMTTITTPPVTLLLALVGVAMLFRSRRLEPAQRSFLVLAAWSLIVNLVPSCLPTSPKYNGVRLFLPIFPFVATLAAVGFCSLVRPLVARFGQAEQRPRIVALALFLALIGPLAATGRFTPFHLSYYNALVGGLPGATRLGMEPTYWGDTYRSAALWLAGNAPQGATIWVEPMGYESAFRLFELGPLRPDLHFSSGPEGFTSSDFAVTQNKPTELSDLTRNLIATQQPVYTDGVDGVPLIYVFRLRDSQTP